MSWLYNKLKNGHDENPDETVEKKLARLEASSTYATAARERFEVALLELENILKEKDEEDVRVAAGKR